MQDINELHAAYRAAPDESTKRELLEQIYIEALPRLQKSANLAKFKNNLRPGVIGTELYDDAIYDTVKRIADHPNTKSNTFDRILSVALANDLKSVGRHVRSKAKNNPRNFTDADQNPYLLVDDKYAGSTNPKDYIELTSEIPALRERFAAGLAKLPLGHLQTFDAYLNGQSYAEIAKEQKIPTPSVGTRIFAVRKALKDIPSYSEDKAILSKTPPSIKTEYASELKAALRHTINQKIEHNQTAQKPD